MRRVIVGVDAKGEPAFVYDGPPQSICLISETIADALVMENVPAFPGTVPEAQCCSADIWETDGLPRRDSQDLFAEPRPFVIEPPGKGMLVRYQVWGANLYAPMHATDTLDIDVVISGEVELMIPGEQSVTLRQGDSIVIPGIEHAWRAGPEGFTMIVVMQKLA